MSEGTVEIIESILIAAVAIAGLIWLVSSLHIPAG